jgi:hypothetical protein
MSRLRQECLTQVVLVQVVNQDLMMILKKFHYGWVQKEYDSKPGDRYWNVVSSPACDVCAKVLFKKEVIAVPIKRTRAIFIADRAKLEFIL